MRKKHVKQMLNLLSTEVKINEINTKFLAFVPKRPKSPEKIRPARIFVPIVLCSILAFMLIGLMLLTINKPIFENDKGAPITETKKMMAYQVVGCLSFIDEIAEPAKLSNDQVKEEVNNYLQLAEYYLHKEQLIIESLVSDDMKYNNKYLIKLNSEIYFYFNEDADGAYQDIDLVSSVIEGYVLINNVKYKVTGSKEVIGKEIKTKLRTYSSDTDFIEVEQDIKRNQNEYEFSCYKDENIIKEVDLAIEENVSSDQLAINEDDKSFDFSLENDKIIADVNIPDVYSGEIVIYLENGEYVYVIE